MCFALERDKGKTVEVGRAYFETEKKHFTILDAPGMIHECKIEFLRNTGVYTVIWIRIQSDPHLFGSVDPDPEV